MSLFPRFPSWSVSHETAYFVVLIVGVFYAQICPHVSE